MAVLIRIFLKIDIVQKPRICPEILLLLIAELLCKIAHYRFHRKCMEQMKWLAVIGPKQV